MRFIRDALKGAARRCAPSGLGLAAALILGSVVMTSVAHAGNLDKITPFNIEAQALGKALLQFAAQAHVQISFAWDSRTASLPARALKGNYTGREALAALLRGTSLTYVAHDQTVAILHKRPPRTSASAGILGVAPAHRGDVSQLPAGTRPTDLDPPDQHSNAKPPALQEVVVTGSRLRTTDKEGPQEVETFDHGQIAYSGQDSVSDFLGTLPSVSLAASTTASGLASTVSLRGLPIGTTLVLLNGRRMESTGLAWWFTGGDFFNLSNIPLAAVQKIEIVESGSSAVYGSDAIAGVVNIITDQRFNGFAADAKYGWAKDTNVVRADLVWGRQWDQGGFSVVGSYDIDGGLLNSNRLLTASNDYTRYGGPDLNFPDCSPGNVFSVDGAPLAGAPAGSRATFAAVSGKATSGKPGPSQFTYGVLNQCSISNGGSIMPTLHRAGLLAQGHLELGNSLTLFSELMYTHVNQEDPAAYQVLFGTPAFQEYTVSASNPFNPFGATVGVAEQLQNALVSQNLSTDFFRPLLGVRGKLPRGWQWEISAWQSADWSQDVLTNFLPNTSAIQNALNASDPSMALNPFVTGPVAPRSLLKTLFADGDLKMLGLDRSAEAFIRGPILSLPAGDVQTVVGGDYVRSELKLNEINDGVDPPGSRRDFSRRYYAVFGEARIPLIAHGGDAKARTVLAVTAAGRRDQYSDFGGDTTEQFGLELRPLDNLLVRGTYASAFKAPSLPNLYAPDTTAPSVLLSNTGPIDVQLTIGGNLRLRPLTGHSHTLGAVYSGQEIPGLTLSVTAWEVVENNDIQSLPAELIVDSANEFPGRVVSNSAGEIVSVNDTPVNFGSIDVAGVDYRADYQRAIGRGILGVHLNGTEVYHYRESLIPGASATEAVSVAQDNGDWAPRWKGSLGVDWKVGPVSAHVTGRYTSIYQDYDDSMRRNGNFWILDTDWRWDFGSSAGGLEGAYIEVGGTNLLNRAPQFSNYGFDLTGYDVAQMSIVGRSLYLKTGVRW